MTDFHSHILPSADDGSKSVAESLEMLRETARQGIFKIVATPHFYPWSDDPESFLKRREEAFEKLKAALVPGLPEIVQGAEVGYFDGISRSSEMKKLRIEGTGLLLIEMPEEKWSMRMLGEIIDLNGRDGMRVALAHVERYIKLQQRGTLEELARTGIVLQSNAEFFINRHTARKAMRLFGQGVIQILGSDAHGAERRPQELGKAAEAITRVLGKEALERLSEREEALFCAEVH